MLKSVHWPLTALNMNYETAARQGAIATYGNRAFLPNGQGSWTVSERIVKSPLDPV